MGAVLYFLMVVLFFGLFVWGLLRIALHGGRGPALGVWVVIILGVAAFLAAIPSAYVHLKLALSVPSSDFKSAVILLGVLVGLIWLLGLRKKDAHDIVLRGSQLLTGAQLNIALYGKQWDKKALTYPKVITVGGAVIPPEFEAQHLLFSGTTGSGKTQAINRVLRAIRHRKRRALIADAGGGFVSRFYQSGDLILNPFDARSVDWSPFAEIRTEYDFARIAKAAIPEASGEAAQWHHYAQTLLGETMLAMYKRGQRSIKQLLHYLTVADTRELGELLTGTPASILCARGNDKMLSNTRGIISTFLVVWRYLPDNGQFSVREWVRNDARSAWLFVTFRDDQLGMLRTLIATLLEIGIIEALSLSEDPKRDLWFVMDEVDSLGKITSLAAGLSKLRKYGCKCVLGLQTIAQLRATYGDDGAQSLLANISTKLVLRAGDGETAEYFSAEFGDQEVQRAQQSHSHSSSNSKSGSTDSESSSVTHVRETKRTILASSIAALPDLHGYLKIASSPIGYIALTYEQLPQTTPSHVENDVASIDRVLPTSAYSPMTSGAV